MTGLVLAKAAGARTIITSSSDAKLQLAKEKYGVDYTINYKTHPHWSEQVNSITHDQGADIIFENGGSGTLAQSLACVARGGQIAVIGFLAAAKPEEMPDVAMGVLGKGCIVRGINVGAKALTEDLVAFACSKNLGVHIEQTYKFEKDEIFKAYGDLEKGPVGKIAIAVE